MISRVVQRIGKKTGTKATARVLTTSIVVLMLAMALLPLISPGSASASDDDIDIFKPSNNGPVIDLGLPTPTPEIDFDGPVIVDQGDDGEENPQIDPDVDIIETPEVELEEREERLEDDQIDAPADLVEVRSSTIYITKYVCPDGFDAAASGFDDLFANCGPGGNGYEFDLVFNGQGEGKQSTGDVVDSAVTWNLPAGFALVQEVLPLPAGFGLPRVFCDLPSGSQEMQLINTTISFDLPANDAVDCEWFNILDTFNPPDIDLLGSIRVNKSVCPVGFDAYAADQAALANNCTGSGNGFDFNLTFNGQAEGSQTTGDVEDSAVVWNLSDGFALLQETLPLPDGYDLPRAFCDLPSGSQEMQLINTTISFDVPLGADVECVYYNIPVQIDGPDIPVDNVSITVTKHNCPDAYDAYAADIYDLVYTCQEPVGDVTFGLSDGNGFVEQLSTGGGNAVTFAPVAPGPYTVLEQVPAGYGEPIVYCETYSQAQPNGSGPEKYLVDSGNQIFDIFEGGTEVYCDWFNVPTAVEDGETFSVTVTKHNCPEGYDAYAADIYDLVYSCQEPVGDVTFGVADGNVYSDFKSTGNGSAVTFGPLAPGPYTVLEQVPDGYGEPIVYCETYSPAQPNGSGPVKITVLAGNQILEIFEGGTEVYCDWFNVPGEFEDQDEGGIKVEIIKTECPYGYDASNADIYDLVYNCQEAMDGVAFEATDGGAPIQKQTAGGGFVTFDGLDQGEWFFSETIPAGYGEPIVFCETYSLEQPNGSGPVKVDVESGNQFFQLLTGEIEVYCNVFNIPTEDNGDGEVVVTKYGCPEGYDAYNADIYDLALNCQAPMNGVMFNLTYPIDSFIGQQTGEIEPSAVVYKDVPAGLVGILETVPANYGQPVVYCEVYSLGQPNGSGPVKYDVVDASISHTLQEGESLYCSWYNVPTYEDGSITVYKYTCDAGYDPYAPNADPAYDCPNVTNGIDFRLEGPNGVDFQGTTGTSGNGYMTWGSLEPGDYTVSELVPDGTDEVFILSCEGASQPFIQSYPLLIGASLDIPLNGGDEIVCSFYNVPEYEEYGTIEVTKYFCDSKSFVDSTYCEIYEGGIGFVLSASTANGWVEVADGTTSSYGDLTFTGLEPGTYEIDEIGGTWCYADADLVNDDGNLVVNAGHVTHVDVYNCGPGKQPTKRPVKYPNTGIGPVAGTSGGAVNAPVRPMGEQTPVSEPRGWMAVVAERLAALTGKGERPVSIKAAGAELDAEIEVLEVVDGSMQDPTTADQAAWYKDLGRLGSEQNVVLAGHVNYWGVPEGVFYGISQLEAGDVIEVTGESGIVYRYRVDWVKLTDATVAPPADLIGETGGSTLTLITCGGEYDYESGLFVERTVVRATLITA